MSEQIASSYPHLFINASCDPCEKKVEACDPCTSSGHGTNKFAYFILWWLILVVIIWFIIYSLQPSWIMKSDDCDDQHHKGKKQNNKCQIDQGKAILISVVIAFILIIIFYFVSRSYWK